MHAHACVRAQEQERNCVAAAQPEDKERSGTMHTDVTYRALLVMRWWCQREAAVGRTHLQVFAEREGCCLDRLVQEVQLPLQRTKDGGVARGE